jgi:uncharacterized membrane protein YtjA (UPF0391 family)
LPPVLHRGAASADTPTAALPVAPRAGCPYAADSSAIPLTHPSTPRRPAMLHYAVVFFVIALIAALFGFTGLAAGAAGIAQILFVVFLILAIGSFILNMFRKSS